MGHDSILINCYIYLTTEIKWLQLQNWEQSCQFNFVVPIFYWFQLWCDFVRVDRWDASCPFYLSH